MSHSGDINAAVALELLQAGREWRARQKMNPPEIAPDLTLRRQIEETKRRALETGADVKPRLLELRIQHRDITGADGG